MFRRLIRSPSSGLPVHNCVILKYRTNGITYNFVIKYTYGDQRLVLAPRVIIDATNLG
jgi:hypothetical protein